MKYTPGPWIWGEGWKVADKIGTVYYEDGENPEIEKYMDMELKGVNGELVIPIRIDHYEMIYDGKPISRADRNLIASAPELLEACKKAKTIFKRLADEGSYPEFMLSENGGEGYGFLSLAIKQAEEGGNEDDTYVPL